MEKIKHEIRVEKLPGEIASEGLKKEDYVIARPTDVYSGAGIYVMKTGNSHMVARCIEKADGSIRVADVSSASCTDMKVKSFCAAVDRKVLARVIVDDNLPAGALELLDQLLRG